MSQQNAVSDELPDPCYAMFWSLIENVSYIFIQYV